MSAPTESYKHISHHCPFPSSPNATLDALFTPECLNASSSFLSSANASQFVISALDLDLAGESGQGMFGLGGGGENTDLGEANITVLMETIGMDLVIRKTLFLV